MLPSSKTLPSRRNIAQGLLSWELRKIRIGRCHASSLYLYQVSAFIQHPNRRSRHIHNPFGLEALVLVISMAGFIALKLLSNEERAASPLAPNLVSFWVLGPSHKLLIVRQVS